MQRTLDEVRREGLEALRERLGRADMIRFLQQFETGRGDYANDRHPWVDRTTLEEIERLAMGRNRSRLRDGTENPAPLRAQQMIVLHYQPAEVG